MVKLSNDMTRAVGGEARNFANYCGYVVRTTISFRQGAEWDNIYEQFKDEMILKVKDKFKPYDATNEEKFEQTIKMNLQNAFRNWKTKLHKHYNEYASDEERRANPPQNISSEDWELLLAYFQTDVFMKKSKRNKSNRGKQVSKHTCGCLSFAEMEFATDDLRDLRLRQEGLEADAQMTSDEILTAVLGERSGYVRGKGYGAEPLRKRNRSHSSDNSAVETVCSQLREEFDKKFQEEREKMEAERARIEAERAEERARIEAERAEERARIEAERAQERAQFDDKMKQMEERILAMLMKQGQVIAPTSSTPGLAVTPADRSS